MRIPYIIFKLIMYNFCDKPYKYVYSQRNVNKSVLSNCDVIFELSKQMNNMHALIIMECLYIVDSSTSHAIPRQVDVLYGMVWWYGAYVLHIC